MTDLAKLVVRLEAETAKYQSELDKAKKQLGAFEAKSTLSAKRIGQALGLSVSAVATGIAALVKHSIDAADEMSKLARSTGLSTEALSQLDYAAKLSGVEDLGSALNKFNRNIGEAVIGTKEQADAFQALGVEVKDASGNIRPTEDILNDVADAFSRYEDGAAKSTIAQKLFGRAGADLISFFDSGRAGLEQLRKEADRYGLTIDNKASKSSEQFNDNLGRLEAQVGGVANQIAGIMVPSLAAGTNLLVEASKASINAAGGLEHLQIKFAATSAAILDALQQLDRFNTVARAVNPVTLSIDLLRGKNPLQEVKDAIDGPQGETAGQKFFDAFEKQMADAQKAAETTGKALALPSEKTNDRVQKAAKEQADAVDQMIQALADQAATLGYNERALALYQAASEGATNAQINQINALYDSIDSYETAQKAAEDYRQEQERLDELFAKYMPDLQGITAAQAEYNSTFGDLNQLLDAGRVNWEQYYNGVNAAQKKLQDSAKETNDVLGELNKELARDIQDDISNWLQSWDGGLKGLAESFGQTIQKILADAAAAQLTSALFGAGGGGSGGGLFGSAFNAIGSFFAGSAGGSGPGTGNVGVHTISPARAAGGPVSAGTSYLVGEKGPEMFVPDRSGDIVPNHALGSGMTVHQTFAIQAPNGSVSRATMAQIGAEAARGLAVASRRNN